MRRPEPIEIEFAMTLLIVLASIGYSLMRGIMAIFG
jgi:hypothetical protein